MKVHQIAFSNIPQFSQKDTDYATGHPKLKPFFKYDATLEAFQQVIEDKKKDPTNRDLLVDVLKEQYSGRPKSKLVNKNINALAHPDTFTVITAHQPALFTGPLYYILKIFSTINLAETLRATYPDYNFVPVFINGAEDHDFEEINHTYFNHQKITWETENGGSVGAISTVDLVSPLEQLRELLAGSPKAMPIFEKFDEYYTNADTYGEAMNLMVHELFKDYGLVVVDMSHAELKRAFIPCMEMEIFDQASYEPVTATQKALEAVDFGSQAFVRPINLFYLQKNKRSRIIAEEDGTFSILDTDLKFTKQKLRELLHEHPERFSPNVVMRPIYQELILPNLAYIGGGGEISYWLERKTQFELFGINFPMLIRRNSALWINHYQAKKIRKLGLSIQDTFTETEELIKTYVRRNSENDLDLENELGQLETVFESYGQKANQVDPTLKPRALAIGAKYKKQIEKLAKRLMREEKRKHEAAIYNIRQIKHELFPNDGLQERKANFLNFYAQEGQYFFDSLKEHLHPLEHGMVVFEED